MQCCNTDSSKWGGLWNGSQHAYLTHNQTIQWPSFCHASQASEHLMCHIWRLVGHRAPVQCPTAWHKCLKHYPQFYFSMLDVRLTNHRNVLLHSIQDALLPPPTCASCVPPCRLPSYQKVNTNTSCRTFMKRKDDIFSFATQWGWRLQNTQMVACASRMHYNEMSGIVTLTPGSVGN